MQQAGDLWGGAGDWNNSRTVTECNGRREMECHIRWLNVIDDTFKIRSVDRFYTAEVTSVLVDLDFREDVGNTSPFIFRIHGTVCKLKYYVDLP